MTDMAALLERVDRLESLDQIRQLPAKYALCVDMREFDAMANLFIEDVIVSKSKRGRQEMKQWYDTTMRHKVIGSAHGINGHIIDFESADIASGLVYSRNDLELTDTWMMEFMAYLDRYERQDGIWYFQRRIPLYWFQCDQQNPPIGGGDAKLRWPDQEAMTGGFHAAFPSWTDFWNEVDKGGTAPVKPAAPLYRFLENFRRGEGAPKVLIQTSGTPGS